MFYKALFLIVCAALISVLLKKNGGEFSFVIIILSTVSIAVIVLIYAGEKIEALKDFLSQNTNAGELILLGVKALIIAYLSETVADTCRDMGQTALASKAELAGKGVIFVLSVPVFLKIADMVLKFSEI